MFNIKIDKNIMTYLGEKRLRVDELVVLMCFVLGKIDMVKALLVGRNGDQCTAFMQAMVRKGLMTMLAPEVEGFDWDNYKVTEEGNTVYEECICNVVEESMPVATHLLPEVDMDEDALVTEFLALWPEGTRNANGDYLRTNAADIEKKLKAFVKKYKFSKETILRGTESYLSRQRAQGFAYCNQAHFFVSKDGISKLASECELAERNVGNTGTWENVM